MKCSNCSEINIRPIICIDIDGTIAEYHDHLLTFCLSYYNLGAQKISYWDGDGNFEDYIGITQEQYREAKLAFRQGGMKRTMPIIPGAARLARGARDAGAEIWMTTTRPWQRLDNVDPDTREWLSRHGIPYDHLLYDEFKYERITELVDAGRIAAIIDDLPEQCHSARQSGLPVTMVARNHNASSGFAPRQELGLCAQWAINNIKEWKKKNG